MAKKIASVGAKRRYLRRFFLNAINIAKAMALPIKSGATRKIYRNRATSVWQRLIATNKTNATKVA